MHFPIAHIEPELQGTERFGAIGELLARLVHAGSVPRSAETPVYRAIIDRENTMSTGVGRVAFPHAASDSVVESVFAFGRSRKGIAFAAIDGLAVEFVLLHIYPTSQSVAAGLAFMRGICPLGDPAIHRRLRDCSTAQEIKEILESKPEG